MNKTSSTTLPVPAFFNPKNAESWGYNPSLQKIFEEAERWRATHTIAPVRKPRIHVLGIDLQKDFCFPEGSLYVGGRNGRGAIDDNVRFAEFIYRNLAVIDDITLTLDTHYPFQIFFPSFWLKEDGTHPSPHTQITTEEIRQGKYRPNPAVANWIAGDAPPGAVMTFLNHQVEYYCAELERAGKYTLYLWPYHCLLGTEGHAITGVINEARLFHAFTRGRQSLLEIKGGHPLTENYSVFKPEVTTRYDGGSLTEGLNTKLLEKLTAADMLIIAGQAASHCVKSSIDDLLDDIMARDRSLAEKVYILRDCTSSVVVPGVVDYTPQAEDALDRYAKAGMHVIYSTDPMNTWPGTIL